MADKNISQFTEEGTRADGQIIYIGLPSGGGFLDRFMTMANLISGLQLTSEKGVANGYASLDSGGKLPEAQLPAIAVVDYLGEVANQTEMLALDGQKGDWCTRTDLGTNFIIIGDDPTVIGGWLELSYPTAPVTSVNGLSGVVVLDASNIAETAIRFWLTNTAQTFEGLKTFQDGIIASMATTTVTASFSLRTAHKNRRIKLAITGNLTITVDDTSASEIGENNGITGNWLSDTGSNAVDFAVGGSQTIVSKDSNVTLSGVGVGFQLIYEGSNTWSLIGGLL